MKAVLAQARANSELRKVTESTVNGEGTPIGSASRAGTWQQLLLIADHPQMPLITCCLPAGPSNGAGPSPLTTQGGVESIHAFAADYAGSEGRCCPSCCPNVCASRCYPSCRLSHDPLLVCPPPAPLPLSLALAPLSTPPPLPVYAVPTSLGWPQLDSRVV